MYNYVALYYLYTIIINYTNDTFACAIDKVIVLIK